MGVGLEQDGWQAVPQLCHSSFSRHIPFASVAVFICENVTLKYILNFFHVNHITIFDEICIIPGNCTTISYEASNEIFIKIFEVIIIRLNRNLTGLIYIFIIILILSSK